MVLPYQVSLADNQIGIEIPRFQGTVGVAEFAVVLCTRNGDPDKKTVYFDGGLGDRPRTTQDKHWSDRPEVFRAMLQAMFEALY